MVFCRQENWSGVPFPTPGNFLIQPMSLASSTLAGGSLSLAPPEKPKNEYKKTKNINILNIKRESRKHGLI